LSFGLDSSLLIPPSSFREAGVALVITLILLSVITFMAVTFLVVTRGERSTVSTITEQTTAKLAAEAGLEAAKAQLVSEMMAFTNTSNIRLLVSTNYQSPWFTNNSASYLNVNYQDSAGGPVYASTPNYLQMLNNLLYLPRVPVVRTNRIYGSNEFLYYLDLNRNNRFDTNGDIVQINSQGTYFQADGTFTSDITKALHMSAIGDPEWVGILERGAYIPSLLNLQAGPAYPAYGYGHSSSNLFISRYSYVVIPTSAALDINNIHNYAKAVNPGSGLPLNMNAGDGYLRNMGVGSWEINLAAFLADLNTNLWPVGYNGAWGTSYNYSTNNTTPNQGAAFEDSLALLRYRYGTNWGTNLVSVNNLFPINGANTFQNDFYDGYSAGPVMLGFHWFNGPPPDTDNTRTAAGWSGSENPQHYFDLQDFFDRSKVFNPSGPISLSDRLSAASNTNNTYDRYTYYRMLEQLGTDSAPEPPKIHLNYRNVDDAGNIVPNMATNFTPWAGIQFFTNAAQQMLVDSGYDTNVVQSGRLHIQIYPTNYYTPSVHRFLQQAANILDASSARFSDNVASNGYPSVFRPLFERRPLGTNTGIYITGYAEVTNTDVIAAQPLSASEPSTWSLIDPTRNITINGVPLVVGAKKGFPAFNEFGSVNDLTVARRMVFHRSSGGPVVFTNQYYTVGISNSYNVEFWHSYSNRPYGHSVTVVLTNEITIALSNQFGMVRRPDGSIFSTNLVTGSTTNFSSWPAYRRGTAFGFYGPRATYFTFLTNAIYSPQYNQFLSPGTPIPDAVNEFVIPRWMVMLTNRVRAALIDVGNPGNPHIIDYVNLESADEPIEISSALMTGSRCADDPVDPNRADLWCTNRVRGTASLGDLPRGMKYQHDISIGSVPISDAQWRAWNYDANDKASAIAGFNKWLSDNTTNQLHFQAPFTPYRTVHQFASWQANDPLVHYTVPDLKDPLSKQPSVMFDDEGSDNPPLTDLWGFPGVRTPLNAHYRPWGGSPKKAVETDPPTNKKLELKDSLIGQSDDWDFPTNKFPNIGWLARVHRGSPWQTIYAKSALIDANTWTNWSGHTNFMVFTNGNTVTTNFDFVHSTPTNDFRLFDLFTTAFNDNASRGQLSVNQTNIAAWSAVLSGTPVLTNDIPGAVAIIEPAGAYNNFNTNLYPPVAKIVAGLNRTRQTTQPGGKFDHIGGVLFTPELTVQSPYINNGNNAVSDAVYERIPLEILSLLRNDSSPRFVVYAFGQSLKPAEHSIYLGGGQYFGMVTNYQITAEAVARAVIRVDNAPSNPQIVVESYNVLPAF